MSRKPAIPFLFWVLCGTIIPFGLILFYGLTDRTGAFTLKNIMAIGDPVHLKALGLSLQLSVISTLICLVIAFPLALILRNTSGRSLVIFIFVLPMWMNFLLRTMAWQVILEKGGVFYGMLEHLHISMPQIINTPGAIVLGMVYDFLPFMILPIYSVVSRIDENVIEAAYDLGAGDMTVIGRIILPMSIPGIASGITMVFVPSLTTFVISNILGGGKIYLIGNIIEQEFTVSANWNLGCGLSIVMMVFIVAGMTLFSKLDRGGEGVLV